MLGLMISNRKGFSLVELLVVIGIMSAVILAMMTMQENQMKANNYLEFQLKRTQLQNTLVGQVFNDPGNCACLFAGAAPFPAMPSAPGATLTGVAPTQIGRYSFATPGVCATATMPQPLVNNAGIDSLKTTSIRLANVMNISGVYTGEILINLQTTKPVLGPPDLPIKIPVVVTTTPSGANVNFQSCSSSVSSSASGIDFTPLLNTPSWYNVVTPNSGGSGYLGSAPYFSIGAVHVSSCGAIQTVTITDPAVTPTTKAALIAFYNSNSNENASFGRVYTTANAFMGAYGQAGRGGDGRSSGSASEMMVNLTNKQFRLQTCSRAGGSSVTSYAIKAVIN